MIMRTTLPGKKSSFLLYRRIELQENFLYEGRKKKGERKFNPKHVARIEIIAGRKSILQQRRPILSFSRVESKLCTWQSASERLPCNIAAGNSYVATFYEGHHATGWYLKTRWNWCQYWCPAWDLESEREWEWERKRLVREIAQLQFERQTKQQQILGNTYNSIRGKGFPRW